MAVPIRILLAALLTSAALAGCTNNDPGASDKTPVAPPDTPPAPAPGSGTSGSGTTGPSTPAPAPPKDFSVTDGGQITGTFERTWPIEVANVAFSSAHVQFALTGMQAGAPPTARVTLTLLDPAGTPVKSGIAGLGGSGDKLDWMLTHAEIAKAGTYTLKASSGSEAPLPSAGFANYELSASITY